MFDRNKIRSRIALAALPTLSKYPPRNPIRRVWRGARIAVAHVANRPGLRSITRDALLAHFPGIVRARKSFKRLKWAFTCARADRALGGSGKVAVIYSGFCCDSGRFTHATGRPVGPVRGWWNTRRAEQEAVADSSDGYTCLFLDNAATWQEDSIDY